MKLQFSSKMKQLQAVQLPRTSFLSVFSSLQSKDSKSKHDDITKMPDIELLANLKENILAVILSTCDKKQSNKITSKLDKKVWNNEYSELKKRLSMHDLHAATAKTKFNHVRSLRNMTVSNKSEHKESDTLTHSPETESIREMATFLLENYYDDPTSASMHIPDVIAEEDDDDDDDNGDASNDKKSNKKSKKQRRQIREKFRKGVRKAMLVNAWGSSSVDMNAPQPTFIERMSSNLQKQLMKVGTWDFDPFELYECKEAEGKCLVFSVWYLFDSLGLFKLFPNISPKKFMNFLTLVETGYLDNPYHNKLHATDVVSNVAYYLSQTQFYMKHTSLFDRFTVILSAAVHDLGHDGNNNAFHINSMSELAIRYNDVSVLENYHVATTFEYLQRPDCNWIEGSSPNALTKTSKKYLRQAMIDVVLATDMKHHNEKLGILTNLTAIINRDVSITDENDKNDCIADMALHKYRVNEKGMEKLLRCEIGDIYNNHDMEPRVMDVNDERRFMLMFLVHLCDISNCAKSLKSGKKWAVRVMEEFFKQGDRERELGLHVSAMMDRKKSSIAGGQVGFIRFILKPAYEVFTAMVPEGAGPLKILNDNLKYWQTQQSMEVKRKTKSNIIIKNKNKNKNDMIRETTPVFHQSVSSDANDDFAKI